MLYNLPVPTLHHFIPAPLPPSSSDSRTSPRSGRSQEEISFLCKRRDLRPQSPTSRTSDDESALAFYDSMFDRRRAAIILKSNGFSLASPVNDGSPPTLDHSNPLLCHSPIRTAKPSARREEAPAKLTPAPPIHRLTLAAQPLPLSLTSSSSPHHLFSFFPSSSYSNSHVPYTVR